MERIRAIEVRTLLLLYVSIFQIFVFCLAPFIERGCPVCIPFSYIAKQVMFTISFHVKQLSIMPM
jgi:hypothetical protein